MASAARALDFSGVVSVVRNGAMTSYARGLVAGPGSLPIDIGTRFNLGSAGKMFTAVAVAQLIDAGKVGLDDPIGRYVAGLTAEASAVTVRQLLTHSSGLGNYFAPENLPAMLEARTLGDLLPLVAAEKPQFPPGSRFSYSDTGFLLLGLMIERASGRSYGDYLQSHIFDPAKMASTGLAPPPARAIGMTSMAAPPGPPGPGPARPAPEAALHGGSAGGAFSTADDMQRFFAALTEGKLTSAASFRRLVSAQIVAAPATGDQPERDYGFGFGVGRFVDRRWFGHNGGAPGVNVEATVFPDDQLAIVVLANRDPPAATLLFRKLRAALFDPAVGKGCGGRP
ncbi:MAG TPA: serine hydrolase domain-containing protein [Caulobacteraceae bacterium]|nr:serine hydrolase domain-containing protein [Caulobacteraceae bacterium]